MLTAHFVLRKSIPGGNTTNLITQVYPYSVYMVYSHGHWTYYGIGNDTTRPFQSNTRFSILKSVKKVHQIMISCIDIETEPGSNCVSADTQPVVPVVPALPATGGISPTQQTIKVFNRAQSRSFSAKLSEYWLLVNNVCVDHDWGDTSGGKEFTRLTESFKASTKASELSGTWESSDHVMYDYLTPVSEPLKQLLTGNPISVDIHNDHLRHFVTTGSTTSPPPPLFPPSAAWAVEPVEPPAMGMSSMPGMSSQPLMPYNEGSERARENHNLSHFPTDGDEHGILDDFSISSESYNILCDSPQKPGSQKQDMGMGRGRPPGSPTSPMKSPTSPMKSPQTGHGRTTIPPGMSKKPMDPNQPCSDNEEPIQPIKNWKEFHEIANKCNILSMERTQLVKDIVTMKSDDAATATRICNQLSQNAQDIKRESDRILQESSEDLGKE